MREEDKDKMAQDELVEIAYEIIKIEKLPKPEYIRFFTPVFGHLKRRGTIAKNNDKFSIRIYTKTSSFFDDEDGKFVNKKTGKKCTRGVGRYLTHDEIVNTVAHEVAHLKFWQHNAQHKSYLTYIKQMIMDRVKVKIDG